VAAQFQTKRVRTPIVSHSWVDEGIITKARDHKILQPNFKALYGL
jgi:hypothetical protein